MSAVGASSLAERIRAAVACLRDVEPAARAHVVLDYVPLGEPELRGGVPRAPRRLLVRRVYDGANKALETRQTVVVALDLDAVAAGPVAIPMGQRSVEILVLAGPLHDAHAPFEGVFDLRGVAVKSG